VVFINTMGWRPSHPRPARHRHLVGHHDSLAGTELSDPIYLSASRIFGGISVLRPNATANGSQRVVILTHGGEATAGIIKLDDIARQQPLDFLGRL